MVLQLILERCHRRNVRLKPARRLGFVGVRLLVCLELVCLVAPQIEPKLESIAMNIKARFQIQTRSQALGHAAANPTRL